jgi:hypothetical protein
MYHAYTVKTRQELFFMALRKKLATLYSLCSAVAYQGLTSRLRPTAQAMLQ